MSHDGLPARAGLGAREASADRRAAARSRLTLLRQALPAAAVCGAFTVVFAACTTGAGGGAAAQSAGGLSSATASTEPSMEASASASASASSGIVTVMFQPMNGSQVAGSAVLTDQPDGTTTVQISLGSTGAEGMTAVLQQGACPTAGASGSPGASGLQAGSASPSGSGGIGAGASGGTGASPATGASLAPAASVGSSGSANGSGAPSGSAEAASASPSAVTGPPYQLAPLTGGTSMTTIATTTSALLAEPYSIVVNASGSTTSGVACADVTNTGSQASSSPMASGLESMQPSLGTEPSPSSS